MNGRPTGAIRVSLGYMSTKEETDRFVDFLASHFKDLSEKNTTTQVSTHTSANSSSIPPVIDLGLSVLSKVIVYPIKSCAGMEIDRWPMGPTGLLFDRTWAIVNAKGVAITQKRNRRLSLIRPRIDLKKMELKISAEGYSPIAMRIGSVSNGASESRTVRVCRSECGTTVETHDTVQDWLKSVLGQTCSLVRLSEVRRIKMRKGRTPNQAGGGGLGSPLSFANEGQFLVVSESSVAEAAGRMKPLEAKAKEDFEIDYRRFRPNFVVRGPKPFVEDKWASLKIIRKRQPSHSSSKSYAEAVEMNVIGPCVRCKMVDIDQKTGVRDSPLLRTLAGFRRKNNQIVFGVLLEYKSPKPSISSEADGLNGAQDMVRAVPPFADVAVGDEVVATMI
ncbi:hypothetical protein AAMO2058_000716300 [Amorphochlora amoebiformis]